MAKWVSRLAACAFVLALVIAIPARAGGYGETFTDGDDSKSPLDLAEVTRTDGGAHMTFTIKTYKGFKASRLDIDRDRYLLLAFDRDRKKNDKSVFERCAFIYFEKHKLRWVATDCDLGFYDKGMAKKPSNKTIKLTLNMATLDIYNTHEWALFSIWDGSPCPPKGCVDAMPNDFPLYLRDFTAPKVTWNPPTLSTAVSNSTTFPVDFTLSDKRGSGVATWELWSMDYDASGIWSMAASGTGGGAQAPLFTGTEDHAYEFYVIATDAQGNWTESSYQDVVVPLDDDSLTNLTTVGTTTLVDPSAYGGSFTVLPDTSASMSFFAGTLQCRPGWLIGPGTGTWTIEIHSGATLLATIDSADIADEPMQVLWHDDVCAVYLDVRLVAGSNAAIDAFAEGKYEF
jgi:hypothetical protein